MEELTKRRTCIQYTNISSDVGPAPRGESLWINLESLFRFHAQFQNDRLVNGQLQVARNNGVRPLNPYAQCIPALVSADGLHKVLGPFLLWIARARFRHGFHLDRAAEVQVKVRLCEWNFLG